jgi:hypothetical protein
MKEKENIKDQNVRYLADRPRVVVRFREKFETDKNENIGDRLEKMGIIPWKKLEKTFPNIELSPVFTYLERGE